MGTDERVTDAGALKDGIIELEGSVEGLEDAIDELDTTLADIEALQKAETEEPSVTDGKAV